MLFGLEGIVYALMISFGIIGIYNLHRLWKFKMGRLPNYINDWTGLNKKSIYVLALIPTLVAMLLYFWLYSFDQLQNILTVFCVLTSVFYVKRIGKFALREIPYLKVVFVLAIWYLLFFIFPYWIFDYDQPWILNFLFLLTFWHISNGWILKREQRKVRTCVKTQIIRHLTSCVIIPFYLLTPSTNLRTTTTRRTTIFFLIIVDKQGSF